MYGELYELSDYEVELFLKERYLLEINLRGLSILDQQKMELLMAALKKYSITELEQRLK